MKAIEHTVGNRNAVELISDAILINSEQDALDIMTNVDYKYNSKKIILHQKNFSDDFFNLKTGLAGAVLQKFITYQFQLAIIGDFSVYKSKSLTDFIYESNKSSQLLFLKDINTALEKLG